MHDDLIAALERAHRWYVELCLRRAAQPNDHAADERIRALVATLRAGGERPAIVRIDPAEYQDGLYLNPVTGQVIRIEGEEHKGA